MGATSINVGSGSGRSASVALFLQTGRRVIRIRFCPHARTWRGTITTQQTDPSLRRPRSSSRTRERQSLQNQVMIYLRLIKQLIIAAMSKIAETLRTYTYNPNKPVLTALPLVVFDAESKESGLKFTLKLFRRADPDLLVYLQKLKSAASDYVVKIYEVINEPETNQLLVVQQAVPYGTLAAALSKPKRFQDDDGLNVSKQLLNGHIDLLRSGLYWTGTEADIDVTENGVKLSWNNSMIYSQNNGNPFPELITKLCVRKDQEGILPFPTSKMIQDLIKVASENASEMSLHPLLKKRDKIFKKKGKNWLGIKQFKLKGEYGQDLTYTAISRQYGLVRVKIFEKGDVDQNLIKVYQTKPAFTKLLTYYDEGETWVTISEYANDGSVQSYVKRLKVSNIQLKENHIEFIFFSLMEPLKFINASATQSFNLLHIKNVYLQNGIPKIGECSPLNQTLRQILTERADVPDFYHRQFKMQPATKDAKYDTYSLGVLLYKLMYTEYPIFPEGQVHIPTTPSYKKTLKDALMLFLNKGGNLTDLENQLQVSDDIKNQVKQNEKLLVIASGGKVELQQGEKKEQGEYHSQLSIGEEEERKEREKVKDCSGKVWDWLNTRRKDPEGRFRKMQLSSFAFYRECTVALVICLLYFLAFFLPYIIGFFNFLSTTQLFFTAYVNVLGQNHRVIIKDYYDFEKALSGLGTLSSTDPITNVLGCLLDDTGAYYSFFKPTSAHWYSYLVVSFLIMVIILVLKTMQAGKFSLVRVFYHYFDQTIDGANESRFVVSSYVYIQLWFFMCLYCFFYLFNFIYLAQVSPCLGGLNWSSLTQLLATDRVQFMIQYFIIIMFTFLMGILSFLQIYRYFGKITYNSLLNPIFIYTPVYAILFILMRIGAYTSFAPSFSNNQNMMIGSSYVNFIGYFPQFLWLAQIILQVLIDLLFYKCADESIERFVLTQRSDEIKT